MRKRASSRRGGGAGALPKPIARPPPPAQEGHGMSSGRGSPGGGGGGGGPGSPGGGGGGQLLDAWDGDCAWAPWAQQADPVAALELDLAWDGLPLAPGAPHPPLRAGSASHWLVHALSRGYGRAEAAGLGLRTVERYRQYVALQRGGADFLWRGDGGGGGGCSPPRRGAPKNPNPHGFATQFSALLHARDAAAAADSVAELADPRWWLERTGAVPDGPTPAALQAALRDLLDAPPPAGAAPPPALELPCAAPHGSLVGRLALHCLALGGGAMGAAALWRSLVSELRARFWDAGRLLPRLPAVAGAPDDGSAAPPAAATSSGRGGGAGRAGGKGGKAGGSTDGGLAGGPPPPDLSAGLLHQKLQMLNVCIFRRGMRSATVRLHAAHNAADAAAAAGAAAAAAGVSTPAQPPPSAAAGRAAVPEGAAAAEEGSEEYASAGEDADVGWEPVGVLGPLPGGACLLHHPGRPLSVPVTQEPPVFTSDALEQQRSALAALGGGDGWEAPAGGGGGAVGAQASEALRARLQGGGLLLSDMSAFKAANPGAVLTDFVRWHSPRDAPPGPDGRPALSARMAAPAGLWARLWRQAAPVPAAGQKPLLDAGQEGERVLHWLEVLAPAALLDALLAAALGATLSLLAASDGAALPAAARALGRAARVAAAPLERAGPAAALSPGEREMLAGELHVVEQAVVLGESLCRRLPGLPSLAGELLRRAAEGDASLGAGGGAVAGPFAPIAAVDGAAQRAELAAWLRRPGVAPPPAADAAAAAAAADGLASALGAPVHREWLLHVGSPAERALPCGGRACCAESRLYVAQDDGAVRVALALVSAED